MSLNSSALSRAWLLAALLAGTTACHHSQPPVARPTAPAPSPSTAGTRPPEPPAPLQEPVMPNEPLAGDSVASRSLDDLNRDSPLKPVFFEYDSAEISDVGRTALQ